MSLQAQSGFQEFISYSGGDSLAGLDMTMTPNGGIGRLSGLGGSYFIGLDTTGVPQWGGTFHFDSTGTGSQQSYYEATPDGGAMVWRDFTLGLGGLDILPGIAVGRFQNDGQVMWSKRYLLPDTLVDFTHEIETSLTTNDDGTALLVVGCSMGSFLEKLLVLKVSTNGAPMWAIHLEVPFFSDPVWKVLEMTDGGHMIAVGRTAASPGVELLGIRLDGNGIPIFANTYDLSNNHWEVNPRGMLEGPAGQCVIVSGRSTFQLSYHEMMWLDQSGAVYRHRFTNSFDTEYWGSPKAWEQDVIWLENRALDSAGTQVLGGLMLRSPGAVGGWNHYLYEGSRQWMDSAYWISGRHFATESVFGYVEERPFLMKVPAWTEFGCRTELIPPAPVDFIEVPDTLLLVAPLNFTWWSTQPDVIDTAGTMVPRNPNSVYDFCTLVSVAEEEPQASVSIWPNPVAQGSVLNVATTAAAALTIRDVSGRGLLHLNKTSTLAQVNITGLAPGHYLITGSDAQNGVRWTKAFMVQ